MVWQVVGVRSPSIAVTERDSEEAVVVEIERQGEWRSMLVVFAGTVTAVNTIDSSARDAVSEYLSWDDPPKQIIANSDGTTTVIE